MQVQEFSDAKSGHIYVAKPPPGISLEMVLTRVVSRELHSPVPLPLEPILACSGSAGAERLQHPFFLRANFSGKKE